MLNTKSNKLIESAIRTLYKSFISILIAFPLVAHAGPAATEYSIELIDGPLPPHPDFSESPWTQITDISDNGIAVWYSFSIDSNDDDIEAAGIYDVKKGEFVTLGEYNDGTGVETGVFVYGINNRGALVTGRCNYINKKGEVIELTHPLYDFCSIRGIASNGLISGYTIDEYNNWRGFVYDPKGDSFEDFLQDSDRNIAQGINSKGQVVGDIGPFADRDGYLRNSDGSARFFKVKIDGVSYPSRARGVSADGTIVGVYSMGGVTNGYVGRLSKDPTDEDLIPTAVFTPDNMPECPEGIFLTRINNSGVISGHCWTTDFGPLKAGKGLLLTPIH